MVAASILFVELSRDDGVVFGTLVQKALALAIYSGAGWSSSREFHFTM